MPHFKASFGGSLPSGEVFQYGLHYLSSDLATAVTAADAFQDALGAIPGFTELFNPTVLWNAPKVSEVDTATGAVTAAAIGSSTIAGASSGSAGACPPQCAIVITLRTGTVGGRGRGRFYLPAPFNGVLDTQGRLLGTPLSALSFAMSAAFAALSAAGGTAIVYSVASRAEHAVTSAEVGDVLDTQRRRRDKLVEGRLSITV